MPTLSLIPSHTRYRGGRRIRPPFLGTFKVPLRPNTPGVFPPMDLLLPTWLRLERDRTAEIAIVPMSPAAPWWTIMKCGLISKIQTFAGTSLTIPDECAKINTHDKLTKLEFAIVELILVKISAPTKTHPHALLPVHRLQAPACPRRCLRTLSSTKPHNKAYGEHSAPRQYTP